MTTIITNGTIVIGDMRITSGRNGSSISTIRDVSQKLTDVSKLGLTMPLDKNNKATIMVIGVAGTVSTTDPVVKALMALPKGSDVVGILTALREIHRPVGNGTILLIAKGAVGRVTIKVTRGGCDLSFSTKVIKPDTLVGAGSGSLVACNMKHLSKKQKIDDLFVTAAMLDPGTSLSYDRWVILDDGGISKLQMPVDADEGLATMRRVMRSVAADKTTPRKRKSVPISVGSDEYY